MSSPKTQRKLSTVMRHLLLQWALLVHRMKYELVGYAGSKASCELVFVTTIWWGHGARDAIIPLPAYIGKFPH